MLRFCRLLLACLLPCTLRLPAQTPRELPAAAISLQDLSAFKPTAGNWKIAGDVFYNFAKGGAGKTSAGTGVVVNDPSGKAKDHLLTTMEHGDIDLDLDFMMDKGSNAGVYLQGRYEVQMFDSWGVANPRSSDCGAIYERWDASRPEGRKGYEGHPPAQNVSRAPGLWQHFRIIFRAPRFNAQGQKIANARFIKVIHNGVTVHENVELTGPTRSGAFTDEKPTGPLMIQGDHGPVAIRNIRYKAYGTEPVTLTDTKLSTYEGKFNAVSEFASLSPKREMPIDLLEHRAPGAKDNFAGKITGTLHLPRAGQYLFSLGLGWIPAEINVSQPNGGGELTIAGKKVISMDVKSGGTATALVDMEAGDHPLVLTYTKSQEFWYARSNDITLALEGPGVAYTTINAPVRAANPVGAIIVTARNQPVMLRSFINHAGKKRTHVMSVGEPGYANYTVDLRRGEFLQVWRGHFAEATPMWYERGETQLAVPLGSVIELPARPSLALMADRNAAWPDSNATYNYLGYDVDPAGRPVFKYNLGTATVRESFAPEDGGRKLTHSFAVTPGQEKDEVWCRVAEGSDITALPNGLYAINDKQYFIELPAKEKPVIRSTNRNTKELLLPAKAGAVRYAIVW